MTVALGIALFIVAATTGGTTYLARRRRKVTMSEWAVGGRSFGGILLWFLSAGEIYTTFAFLGAAGWAYAYGAPGFYILANAPLGYVIGYWLLPKIWRAGHDHNVMSQADYIRARFGRRWLAGLIALIGVLALIPYIQVQLTGLATILTVMFHGSVGKPLAVLAGALLLLIFTFTAGLRSSAFASMVKDVFVVGVVVAVFVTIGTLTGLGGIGGIFRHMADQHPNYANLPGMASHTHYSPWWFCSSILMTNIGYWMWPHSFQANLSAKSDRAIRRNAVLQPIYTLSYFFIFVIGFAALLTLPRLTDSNTALVSVIYRYFPQWFIGIAAGTGILVALVPSTVMLLTLGTTIARNIYRPSADLSDRHRLLVGRLATVVGVGIAAYLTLGSSSTIVSLLLVAYSGIAQVGPAIILSLIWRRTTAYGVAAGSIVGIALVGVPQVSTWWSGISSIQVGLFAVAVNTLVLVAVSLCTRAPEQAHIVVGIPETALPRTAPARA